MNLINDLKNILKDDKEHFLGINIAWDGVRVYLDYDPDAEFEEKWVIPIYYDTTDRFAYIPDDEYRKKYNKDNSSDYGIDSHEAKLISKIMDYLELHGDEIDELCKELDFQNRECYKKDEGVDDYEFNKILESCGANETITPIAREEER